HMFIKLIHSATSKEAEFTLRDEDGVLWQVSAKPAATENITPEKFFFIDSILQQDKNELRALRRFDDEKDSYLQHHLVRGKPTLPGTFMLEMAAQAAKAMRPDLQIVEIRNASFQKFIRPPCEIK